MLFRSPGLHRAPQCQVYGALKVFAETAPGSQRRRNRDQQVTNCAAPWLAKLHPELCPDQYGWHALQSGVGAKPTSQAAGRSVSSEQLSRSERLTNLAFPIYTQSTDTTPGSRLQSTAPVCAHSSAKFSCAAGSGAPRESSRHTSRARSQCLHTRTFYQEEDTPCRLMKGTADRGTRWR